MSGSTLDVTVVEARNLNAEDKLGQNYLCVEIYVDKHYKQQTSVIKDYNDPQWNETFTFNVLDHDHDVHIQVYNKGPVSDRTIGSTKISLGKVRRAGGEINDWFQLPGLFGLTSNGEVHLIIKLT